MQKSQIKKQLTLRQLGAQDVEEFNRLLRYAFQVTEKDLFTFGWNNTDIKQSKYPVLQNAHVLGWFHGDKLASQIALYPMQINIYNTIFDMGGITGVATYPEYSGIGLMSDLMKEILATMRRNKQSISCLYPYSIPYYRSRGWEIVSDKMTFSMRDHQTPKVPPVEGMIQRVDCGHKDLIALHDEFARQTHGCLIRNKLAWDEYWRWDVDDEVIAIYYDRNDKPAGYMVYLLENDVFYIKELVYLNQEAHYGLWGYINAHQSMFDKVKGANYSNHNLAFLLEDGHIKETTKPYIMARIVDVYQFLMQYPFDPIAVPLAILFIVQDPLLEWNNRQFLLSLTPNGREITILDSPTHNNSQDINNAKESCNREGVQDSHKSLKNAAFLQDLGDYDSQNTDTIHTLSINIQTLTTMLMGYKRPLYLRQIGRFEASNQTIDILEEIIPEGKAYFSDYF